MENLTKSLKVEVSNIGDIFEFKEISSHIHLGWNICSVIPVLEEGKPYLLFVLEKKVAKQNIILISMLVILTLIEAVELLLLVGV